MNPVQNTAFAMLAKLAHLEGRPEDTVTKWLLDHFATGYVVSAPDYVVLFKEFDGNWVVTALVGRTALRKLFDFLPYELPLILFRRGGRGRDHVPRAYQWQTFRRAIERCVT
jgi:hypothetical protein